MLAAGGDVIRASLENIEGQNIDRKILNAGCRNTKYRSPKMSKPQNIVELISKVQDIELQGTESQNIVL